MATGCNRLVAVIGLFLGQSEQLVSIPFASLAHFITRNRPALLRTGLSVPVNWTQTTPHRTMTPNRVTWLSIGATLGLIAWAAIGLQSQTAELLTACRQGPEPAACELRLLGR